MGYSKNKRKNQYRIKGFVALPLNLLNSKAFIDLKFSSAKALPYFAAKTKSHYEHPEFYQTQISFTYSEAKRYGFAPGTFFKVIKELVLKGFVEPVSRGGKRGDGYTSSYFKMSSRWKTFGTADFKAIQWECIFPKTCAEAMPKKKTYKSKKGNEMLAEEDTVSEFEVVEPVFA